MAFFSFLKKKINIVVASHVGEAPRNISLPVYVLSLVVVGIISILGVLIFLGYNYAQGVIDVKRIEYIEKQNEIKKRKIEIMEKTIPEIEEKLQTLEGIEMKLKEMHNLENDDISERDNIKVEDKISNLDNYLKLSRDIRDKTSSILSELKTNSSDAYNNLPTLKPSEGWIMRDFGPHESPFTGTIQMHRGIDIVGETGQPIWATADGVVVFAGVKGGYGLSIEIDHGNGYTTFYGHNKSNLVIEGDTVTRGTTIALMGSTGRSTGTHLHYEVRKDGVPINPDGFMLIE